MDVLCDTSFLIAMVSTPLKGLERAEAEVGRLNFLVPNVVLRELENLELRAGPKRSHIAKSAREFSESKLETVQLPAARHVDEAIIQYAKATKCLVATLDRSLKDKLLREGTVVVSLSNNRFIITYPR
ncbi:MAG: hypothetical protein M3297_00920 [Thermoproteota archaeon]|nr:hypothetical protein [Thermoproteota archaeon]